MALFREIGDRVMFDRAAGSAGVRGVRRVGAGDRSGGVVRRTVLRSGAAAAGICLQMAVGATRQSVEWMFLRERLTLLFAVFVVGAPAALFVTRRARSMLFGLSP